MKMLIRGHLKASLLISSQYNFQTHQIASCSLLNIQPIEDDWVGHTCHWHSLPIESDEQNPTFELLTFVTFQQQLEGVPSVHQCVVDPLSGRQVTEGQDLQPHHHQGTQTHEQTLPQLPQGCSRLPECTAFTERLLFLYRVIAFYLELSK